MDAKCDYCGKEGSDMMPSFWRDRTRWFCGIDCLNSFKAVAIGSPSHDEEALDGEPGTAKAIFEKMKQEETE